MKKYCKKIFWFIFFAMAMNYSVSVISEPLCMKNSHSEEDINICQHAEAKKLELELYDLETKVRSRFKTIQAERFDEAQTRWQQMTEKDCEIEAYFYEGAPIYPAIQAECLQRHYQDRMETLKKYLCPEHSIGNGCDSVEPTPKPVTLPTNQTKIKGSKRFR